MTLATGTRLGPYEIVAQIGAGGMGEVYRARDTKLNRDVAIKVLPEVFAADPDRLARFTREAQTLAALNHPNIAQIYGVVDHPAALVMELAGGEDLSAIIARGPLPLADALAIARQIADALEAAHEQGIVHRDLKPANVKVNTDGTVKVLDFGLAKAMDPLNGSGGAASVANSPTLTAHATNMGVILGTAAYMAPEQARGKAVDRRADVWAFGVLLFEMLTGRRAFAGNETSDVLAAVLREEPDLSHLPAGTPPTIRRMLARCLRKERRERLGDMSAVRLEITDALGGAPAEAATSPSVPFHPVAGKLRVAIATAAATALIVSGGLWMFLRPAAAPAPLVHAQIPMPAGLGLEASGVESEIAVSDTHLAFIAGPAGQLFVRALAGADAVPVPGATGARLPAFSPDGQSVAYFSQRDRRLKKVPVGGGPSSDLANDIAWPTGIDWGPAGIVFSDRLKGILTVASDGGTPRAVLKPDKASVFITPSWLPNGHAILYTLAGRIGTGDIELAGAKVLELDLSANGKPVPVADGFAGRIVPPRSLVFMRDNALLAMKFDPDTARTSGGASTILNGIAETAYAVSSTGTLAFQPDTDVSHLTFVWVDRQNHVQPTGIPPQRYTYPRISPDGTRITIASRSDDRDLWTWDLNQRALTRLTFEPGADSYPVWTPDGRSVIYAAAVNGADENLAMRAADGTGSVQVLLSSERHQTPYTISPDGEWLVFRDEVPGHGTDLDILRMRTREARPLIATPFNERNAEISPDGKLIAYQSDETGTMEIYVRPFPNVDGGKKKISNGGGIRPAWSRDGRHLFYLTGSFPPASMNAVERRAGAPLDFGPVEVLFDTAPYRGSTLLGRTYDVAADGRFLMPRNASDSTAATNSGVSLILNWAAHLPTNGGK